MSKSRSVLLFLTFLVVNDLVRHGEAVQNYALENHVCIVGGGIAGASTAYFLRNTSRISLFETAPRLGGRIASIVLGQNVCAEAGASIIAAENRLLSNFASLLNLSHSRKQSNIKSNLALWDGASFLLTTSNHAWRDVVTLFWRYGISLLRMRSYVGRLLRNFDNLYDSADVGYVTVEHFFRRAPGLYDLTQKRFVETLTNSLASDFVNEFISAITRVNYNQEVEDMNGFAGAVAIAGSGGGLWSVAGGNSRLVQDLVRLSAAKVYLSSKVTSIQLSEHNENTRRPRYAVTWKTESDNTLSTVDNCDAVVLAAPIETANIDVRIRNFRASAMQVDRKYTRTVATFVEGALRPSYFGLESRHDLPGVILTTAHANTLFSSIGLIQSDGLGREKHFYKIFSKRLLTVDELSTFFEQGFSVLHTHDWLAYPAFRPPEAFSSFAPAGDEHAFFYTAPIESAASAMEMSALSGQNVAALVRRRLHLDDSSVPREQPRDEL